MRLAPSQAHLLLQKKDNHHSMAGWRSKVSHESQPALSVLHCAVPRVRGVCTTCATFRNLIPQRFFVKIFLQKISQIDRSFLTSQISSAIFDSSPAFIAGKMRLAGAEDRDDARDCDMSKKVYLIVSLLLLGGV
jgi:hypothetical protein